MGQVQANLDTTKEIRGLDIEIKGLANMLELRNFDKTPLDNEFNGYYDISRALITSGDLSIQNQLTSLGSNIQIDTNAPYYIDYNIHMKTGYKYSIKIYEYDENDNFDSSYNFVENAYSYSKIPQDVKALYNYNNNSFNISWNKLGTSDLYEHSTLSYDVWIYYKDLNNLVKFNSSSNNIIVTSGDQSVDGSQFNIQKGSYYFYVTPNFATNPGDLDGPVVRGYDSSDFQNQQNNVVAPPQFTLNIVPEVPSDFKITSPYDGKISFSWKHNSITPSKYKLTLTGNTSDEFNIDGSVNTFTLDNTDLENNGYEPGNYSISLIAIYKEYAIDSNTIKSNNSNVLTFNIPVTNIDFTYKLVDLYGVETTNLKNGVEGIIINWNKLSYATYYKILIKEYDENQILQNTLTYSEPGDKDTISLKWNFKNSKSQFEIQMSYTTYVYGEGESPENSDDALAEDYLGQSGQSYDKLFVPVGSGGLGGEGGIIGSIPIGSI
tara:strand:- start:723 stop:2198 length:1476 start_codon:yes stop_codon:yes gene_type:complete